MLPRTLSASALKTAMACPSRYNAEHFMRGTNFQGSAAGLGTALHAALEAFIMGWKIKKTLTWKLEILLELFDKAYHETIGSDKTLPEYKDGRQILTSWFFRPSTFDSLVPAKVLSVEIKNTFPLKVIHQGRWIAIPFNYIFDRLDHIGDEEYRVVDYKSNRWPLSADELRGNIQARAYAVAVATKYPNAKKIWVQFDFLRHETVGVAFTRDDNVETYRMMQREAQSLVDLNPHDPVPERLNPECNWCVRKASCETLARNINVGGLMSLSLDDKARKLHDVKSQLAGLTTLVNDLERQIILHAAEEGETEFETKNTTVKVWSGMRRKVDILAIAAIVGPAIMQQYNNIINVSDLDSLQNHPDLTPGQKAAIKGAVTRVPNNPSVKVVLKK